MLCDYTKGEKTSISLLCFRTGVIITVTFKEVYDTPKRNTAADQADNADAVISEETEEKEIYVGF